MARVYSQASRKPSRAEAARSSSTGRSRGAAAGSSRSAGASPQRRQELAGQIAAPDPEVLGHVAEDVRHLQGLSEAHAPSAHDVRIPSGAAGQVRHGHLGPEFPHAARRVIGVAVEIGSGLQGGESRRILTGEGGEIGLHSLDEQAEDAADARPVVSRQRRQGGEARREVEQELALCRDALRAGQGAGDLRQIGGGRIVQRVPQALERAQASGARHQAGVGDGVSRPCQQVGETQRPAERPREDAEAQANDRLTCGRMRDNGSGMVSTILLEWAAR